MIAQTIYNKRGHTGLLRLIQTNGLITVLSILLNISDTKAVMMQYNVFVQIFIGYSLGCGAISV